MVVEHGFRRHVKGHRLPDDSHLPTPSELLFPSAIEG